LEFSPSSNQADKTIAQKHKSDSGTSVSTYILVVIDMNSTKPKTWKEKLKRRDTAWGTTSAVGSDQSANASPGDSESSPSSSVRRYAQATPFDYLIKEVPDALSVEQNSLLQSQGNVISSSGSILDVETQVENAHPSSSQSEQSQELLRERYNYQSRKQFDEQMSLDLKEQSSVPFLVEARDEHLLHSPVPLRRHHSSVTAAYEFAPLPLYSSDPSLPSMLLNHSTPSYSHNYPQWKTTEGITRRHQVPDQSQNRQYQSDSSINAMESAHHHGSGLYVCSHGSASPSLAASCSSSPSQPATSQYPAESDGFENLADALANRDGGPAPLYRRFQIMNHRVLLHLQDEISRMEIALRKRDDYIKQISTVSEQVESASLTSESSRRRQSLKGHLPETYQPSGSPTRSLSTQVELRTQLLGRIFVKLGQYSKMMQFKLSFGLLTSIDQALATYSAAAGQFSRAETSEVLSFKEWVSKNAIIRDPERIAFLEQELDLVSLDRPIERSRARSTSKSSPGLSAKDMPGSTRQPQEKELSAQNIDPSLPKKSMSFSKSWLVLFIMLNVLLMSAHLISSAFMEMSTKLHLAQLFCVTIVLSLYVIHHYSRDTMLAG
jgi:hypothetical protein